MIILYFFLLLALGIYSYSQIDLNLTLLQAPWFLAFQNTMIQLGYFNRPVSAIFFVILTLILNTLFLILFFRAEKLSAKHIFLLIAGVVVMGLVSYPAFSHDIFNYIFDARIAVYHNANPYTSTALMFPLDTWTRFMNWTHRTYPYGPVFLPLSIPFYLLGLNKFVLTLISFKAMAMLSFAGSAYLLYRLSGKKGLIFFALNPLIIYEAVVAAHLDIMMLFFALLGYFLILQKRKIAGIASWLVSVGIKYATVIQLPALWPGLNKKYKEILLVVLAYAGALIQTGSRELLPHYFIVPIGFSALLAKNRLIFWGTVLLSFILIMIRYYPFLATGQWR